jgi:hypothetical protein
MTRGLRWCLWALVLLLASRVDAQELTVSLAGEGWVRRDAPLRLTLSRPVAAGEGRLAVVLDLTDVTDLFERDGADLVYRPAVLPLPPGEHQLRVYRVGADGEWQEVSALPLKVLTSGGFERAELTPRLDLQSKAQNAEGHSPADNAPPRETFEDATVQVDVGGRLERGGWTGQVGLNVTGVTNVEEALRFGEMGEGADRVDLASYSARLEKGRGLFELGHFSWGDQRHLISGFGSRGVALGLPLGRAVDLSAVAGNGSAIVGWDNFLGLDDTEHRVVSGRLGVELVPSRPGGLRLEGTYLDGSLRPRSGFNQGVVNDAETSRGWAVRLATGTPGQRLRLDAGYTRSEFSNPADPLLAQGDDLVAVRPETRNARYLDLDLDLVQGKQLAGGLDAGLGLSLRHSRVEPQFRSVAAYAQADFEENSAALAGNLGPVSLQVSHARAEDNLDEIPSILKTKTRRTGLHLALPLSQLVHRRRGGAVWLPVLTYGYDRTHQFGAELPVDAGFADSHVPDQVSAAQSIGVDWQGDGWRAGYRLSASDQDNRQPGRERDDFSNLDHGLSVGLTPHPRLDLGLEYASERAHARAQDRFDFTDRWALDLLWRVTDRLTLTGNRSLTETEDDPRTAISDGRLLDLQGTWQFTRERGSGHRAGGQLYVRYSSQEFSSDDEVFGVRLARDNWTVNSGLTLSID